MAGAGLLIIKRRIKSITNTRKITKAMSLVATAKQRRAKQNLIINEGFHSECIEIIKDVFENYEKENIFTLGNNSEKELYVVFNSEMGLCGGFNANIINKVVDTIKENFVNAELLIIGQRGRIYLSKFGYDTSSSVIKAPQLPCFKDAQALSQEILKIYTEGRVGKVFAIFTRYISGVKQVVEKQKLLPLPHGYKDCCGEIIAFEPDMDLVASEAVKLYLSEKLLYCMLNSTSSEHSARMNSMNSATRNADELLDKLKLKYNRVRQSMITQEISEIIGGAEALK